MRNRRLCKLRAGRIKHASRRVKHGSFSKLTESVAVADLVALDERLQPIKASTKAETRKGVGLDGRLGREAQAVLRMHLRACYELDFRLLVRDGFYIVGREPSADVVIEQSIPPAGLELSEHLDERALGEREGAGII